MTRQLTVIFLIVLMLSSSASAVVQLEFTAPKAFPGGGTLAIGDFNSDGKLDVVSLRANGITLTLGSGDGRFASSSSVVHPCGGLSSNEPSRPLAADFTGDGKLDIAVWMPTASCVNAPTSRALALFSGNGDGTFAPPVVKTISPFFLIPDQFAAADMNGDGMADVVLSTAFASGTDNIGVFLSTGGGDFADPAVYPVGAQPGFTLTVGDFTSDGRPDVVVARRHLSELAIFVNNGSGGLAAPQSLTPYDSFARVITAGDFNADGKLDIGGIVQSGAVSFQVWNGNGNGTVTTGANVSIPALQGNSFISLAINGKFTADNDLDVAIGVPGRLQILKGGGNGTFAVDELYGVGIGQTFPADFNNDGRSDILTTQTHTTSDSGSPSGTSQEFAVILSSPDGSMLTAPNIPLPIGGGSEVAVADLTNDGLSDFAITGNAFDGEILVLIRVENVGLRSSALDVPVPAKLTAGIGFAPRAIATADFNNDGKIDVVAAGEGVFGGTTNVLVAKNNGTGNLSLFTTMALGGSVVKVLATDLNGDGKQDLVFAQSGSATTPGLVVALGNGTGTFNTPVNYLANMPTRGAVAGDLTGDLRPDIAVLRGANVDIFINNGSGGFTAGSTYPLPANGSDIEMSDLNSDGKIDVVAAYESDVARVAIFFGDGNGSLSAPVHYVTNGTFLQKLTLADLSGDGKPDVATTNNGVVTILRNNGSGELVDKTMWFTTGGLKSLTAADLNGDAKLDLVTSSIVDNYVTLGLMFNFSSETSASTPFDFDGDGKTDIGIFRPSNGQWWIDRSSNGSTFAVQFGIATDEIAPTDYTGDGKTDVALWRPSSGEWFILRSEDLTYYSGTFGTSGDIPAPADYDGDGKADVCVFRPTNATWYIQRSSGGTLIRTFGADGDRPVPADYDGDGKADVAIYRPSVGQWWLDRSAAGAIAMSFGNSTDLPVQGDYTGDGKADVAFWRSATGDWFILRSEDFSFYSGPFGTMGDKPAPGDYDGDGRFDPTVFRPSQATWYSQRSTGGTLIRQFGLTGDQPVATAFVR